MKAFTYAAVILLICGVSVCTVSESTVQYSTCQSQFLSALGRNDTAGMYKFIDSDTPDNACRIKLCQLPWAECNQLAHLKVPTSDLYLVFSDEFNTPNRQFGVNSFDPRWTAEDLYYFPTQDVEVYKPEQVTTWNGHAVITMEHLQRPESAISLQPDGTQWNVFKNYKSGMVNSWNKWCFTGGYMEMSVKLPGSDQIPGFWPAFWSMGNLGRAGYMPSTQGLWPYSYDNCGNGSSQATAVPGSEVPPQILSSCPPNVTDPNFINRTLYGMEWGRARNAPEFDVFEIIVTKGVGASASQTLQMAPLLPPGQSWTDLQWYAKHNVTPEGVQYPGGASYLATQGNSWSGIFGRPGNLFQDSMSAVSSLNSTFYESFHTFGLDWAPGEYLRWYVDGIFAYEINPNALLPRQGIVNGSVYTIGERIIPVEPMYLIWNLGMSETFGVVDIQNLQFPAYMFIDYIRVYQRPSNISVGCNPPGYPTEQWIACHKDKYMTNPSDSVLFAPCKSSAKSVFTLFNLAIVLVCLLLVTLLL